MMGHLNFSAREGGGGGGVFEEKISKNSNARGVTGGGVLKHRFDWYIILTSGRQLCTILFAAETNAEPRQ